MDPVQDRAIRTKQSPTLQLCAVVVAEKCVFNYPNSFFGRNYCKISSLSDAESHPYLNTAWKMLQLPVVIVWNGALTVGTILTDATAWTVRTNALNILRIMDLCAPHLEPLVHKAVSLANALLAKLRKVEPKAEENVEDVPVDENTCGICYSQVQEGQKAAPIKCCKNNKLHEACLKQWLNTKNECPLCRAPDPLQKTTNLAEERVFHRILLNNTLGITNNELTIDLDSFKKELAASKEKIQCTERVIHFVGLRVITVRENEFEKPVNLYLPETADLASQQRIIFSDLDITKLREDAEEKARRAREMESIELAAEQYNEMNVFGFQINIGRLRRWMQINVG